MDYAVLAMPPIYGLSIWTSIQTGSASAPAGNWNITIKQGSTIITNFIYPAGKEHYAYWYYSIEPAAGVAYTIEATYGTAAKTVTYTLSDLTPKLSPLTYSQISATLDETTKDITITWPAVTNAKSYYVNLWAEVWNSITKQAEYKQVWGGWVNTNSIVIAKSTSSIPADLECDVYVTAHEVDMTAASPQSPLPTRADMSENYYGYTLPFFTP